MKVRIATTALLFVLAGSGCATWERQNSQVPAGSVQLADLTRTEYRVGERITGEATVRVQRSMFQKLLSPLFGKESVSGDQTVDTGLLTTDEKTTRGVRGGGLSAASSVQLGDLLGIVLGQLGMAGGGDGSSAISHATAAAYFRALESIPGADFLLEPRVTVVTKGTSNFLFFIGDDETATVKVSGRPVTIVADGEQRVAPSAPVRVQAEEDFPRQATTAPSAAAKPAAIESAEIDIGRRSLLELDASAVRSLKQLIGWRISARLASGENKSGMLEKVERVGLTIDGAIVPWASIVSVGQVK